MSHVCFLSGLEIPKGKFSREHFVPRSRLPEQIAQHPYNIYPAIKIFNFIKGNRLPCEWEKEKYHLVLHAYYNWRLKPLDKKLLRQALSKGMPKINPCDYCICSIYKNYCVKSK